MLYGLSVLLFLCLVPLLSIYLTVIGQVIRELFRWLFTPTGLITAGVFACCIYIAFFTPLGILTFVYGAFCIGSLLNALRAHSLKETQKFHDVLILSSLVLLLLFVATGVDGLGFTSMLLFVFGLVRWAYRLNKDTAPVDTEGDALKEANKKLWESNGNPKG